MTSMQYDNSLQSAGAAERVEVEDLPAAINRLRPTVNNFNNQRLVLVAAAAFLLELALTALGAPSLGSFLGAKVLQERPDADILAALVVGALYGMMLVIVVLGLAISKFLTGFWRIISAPLMQPAERLIAGCVLLLLGLLVAYRLTIFPVLPPWNLQLLVVGGILLSTLALVIARLHLSNIQQAKQAVAFTVLALLLMFVVLVFTAKLVPNEFPLGTRLNVVQFAALVAYSVPIGWLMYKLAFGGSAPEILWEIGSEGKSNAWYWKHAPLPGMPNIKARLLADHQGNDLRAYKLTAAGNHAVYTLVEGNDLALSSHGYLFIDPSSTRSVNGDLVFGEGGHFVEWFKGAATWTISLDYLPSFTLEAWEAVEQFNLMSKTWAERTIVDSLLEIDEVNKDPFCAEFKMATTDYRIGTPEAHQESSKEHRPLRAAENFVDPNAPTVGHISLVKQSDLRDMENWLKKVNDLQGTLNNVPNRIRNFFSRPIPVTIYRTVGAKTQDPPNKRELIELPLLMQLSGNISFSDQLQNWQYSVKEMIEKFNKDNDKLRNKIIEIKEANEERRWKLIAIVTENTSTAAFAAQLPDASAHAEKLMQNLEKHPERLDSPEALPPSQPACD